MEKPFKTRLGKTNLEIKAVLRNDKVNEIAAFAMQYLVWHSVGSLAFNGKSDFKREAAFSDGLAKHVSECARKVLGDYFTGVEIKTSAYTGTDKLAKLIKDFVGLGFSEDEAKVMAQDAQAKLDAKNKDNQPAVEAAIAE